MKKYERKKAKVEDILCVLEERRIYDLRERTFAFAKRILEIAEILPATPTCSAIRTQLIKAGTSVGANI